jgi:hypothetical protein
MLAPEKTTETKRNPNAAEMDAGLSTYLDPCGDEEYRDKPKGSRKKSVDYLKLFPPREIHKKRIAFMLRSKKQLTKIVRAKSYAFTCLICSFPFLFFFFGLTTSKNFEIRGG